MSKQRSFSLIERATVVVIILLVAVWLWLILH